jgi:hypothetical protein
MDFSSRLSYRPFECIAANGRFQQGMNTIILPRAIALQCQLNDTLNNLASLSTGDPLHDPALTFSKLHCLIGGNNYIVKTQ